MRKRLIAFSFAYIFFIMSVSYVYGLEYASPENGLFLTIENTNARDLPTEGDILKLTVTPENINATYFLELDIGTLEFLNSTADNSAISGKNIMFTMKHGVPFVIEAKVQKVEDSGFIIIKGNWWQNPDEKNELEMTQVYVVKKSLFDEIYDLMIKPIIRLLQSWFSSITMTKTECDIEAEKEGLRRLDNPETNTDILSVTEKGNELVYTVNVSAKNPEKIQLSSLECLNRYGLDSGIVGYYMENGKRYDFTFGSIGLSHGDRDLRKLKESGYEIFNVTFDKRNVAGYFENPRDESIIEKIHVTKIIVANKEVLSIPIR